MQEPGKPVAQNIFDSHHPPSDKLIDDCVHCGFCLPACPTYRLWGKEMDSPRGRIYLMKLGLQGEAAITDTYVSHFDSCLGCMACVTACPSGVQYDKLIEAVRPQLERNNQRSFADRFFRHLIFMFFPHPNRLRWLLKPLWLYQQSGLQRLVRSMGLMNLLPQKLQVMEALAPRLQRKSMNIDAVEHIPALGPTRRKVGLLLGCVQRLFFSDVNAATARVLAAEGCEVIIPKNQGCCGALMFHSGLEQEAIVFARRLIDVFDKADIDTIVINSAGCGSTLKEYGYLLRDEPEYAEKAEKLAAKCKDISEVLAELEPRAPRHPIRLRVAYHDACHLQHAQRVVAEPRQVLGTIPELDVLEIPENEICCGSAGIYNLVEPEPAGELGDRKVQNVMKTGADVLVSGNPGCLLQIMGRMEQTGKAIPTLHMVELLDASIRGVAPNIELQATKQSD